MHRLAEETAETNGLWGPHSELHLPREMGARPNGLRATEEGGSAEATPSGHSLEIKEKFISSLIQEFFFLIQRLPLHEGSFWIKAPRSWLRPVV